MTNIMDSAGVVAPEMAASTAVVSAINQTLPFDSIETTVVTVASALLAAGLRWLCRKLTARFKSP